MAESFFRLNFNVGSRERARAREKKKTTTTTETKSLKSANIQRTDLYLVSFKSLGSLLFRKIKTETYDAPVKAFERQAIKSSSGQMRQLYAYANESTQRMVEDGMSTGLTNTHTAGGFSVLYHVFARKQFILCSALRHKSYFTLLHVTSIRDSFCLGAFTHGVIWLLIGNYSY